MAQTLFNLLREWLTHYGYGAIAALLLFENLGLPVPGETVLLLAGFLAFSQRRLELPFIILAGIIATNFGSCMGYLIGQRGGLPLLQRYQRALHLNPAILQRGEDLFARYGAAAIFGARFVAGLRIFAGPLAGVLRMKWRTFLLFNFLGSVLWVTVIAGAGYLFGRHWARLLALMRDVNAIAIVAAVILVGCIYWRRRRARIAQAT